MRRRRHSLPEALEAFGPAARARLRPRLERAQLLPPPGELVLLGFKEERRLELWGRSTEGPFEHVRTWEVLAASGGPGPKLREGDQQVPEGLYRVIGLNPASRFHLSLELDYPNDFDRARARNDERDPGGEIFIHGRDRSSGCLALGDDAVEELFVLAADVGIERFRVILSPRDPRGGRALVPPRGAAPWVAELYDSLERELAAFVN